MTNVLRSRTSVLHEIANIYEANTDDGNEWDSNEIVERIADMLLRLGFFSECKEHGVWPTGQFRDCPRCNTDNDKPPTETEQEHGN